MATVQHAVGKALDKYGDDFEGVKWLGGDLSKISMAAKLSGDYFTYDKDTDRLGLKRGGDYYFKGGWGDIASKVDAIISKGKKKGYDPSDTSKTSIQNWRKLGYQEILKRNIEAGFNWSNTYDKWDRDPIRGGSLKGQLVNLYMSPEYRTVLKRASMSPDDAANDANKGPYQSSTGQDKDTTPKQIIDKTFLGQRAFLKIGGDDAKALGWLKDADYGSSGFGMKDINRLFSKGGTLDDLKVVHARAKGLGSDRLKIGGKVSPLINYDWGDGDAKAFGKKDWNELKSRGLSDLGIKKLWEGRGDSRKDYRIGSWAANKIKGIEDAPSWTSPDTTKDTEKNIYQPTIDKLIETVNKLTTSNKKRTMSISASQHLQGNTASGVGSRRSARFRKGLTSKGTSQLSRSGRALAKSLNIA